MLRGKPHEVEIEVTELLDETKKYPNFILSTGCDLPQETPPDNIKRFVFAGRDHKV